jgi:hypothetical protein
VSIPIIGRVMSALQFGGKDDKESEESSSDAKPSPHDRASSNPVYNSQAAYTR